MEKNKKSLDIVWDDWQNRFLDTSGDKILCCGRQIGKTEVCAEDAKRHATTHKNQTILMIAPTERQAHNLFNKTLQALLRDYPKMIKMGKDRPTLSRIILTNQTVIYCLPTGTAGMGIRGLTIHRLYVDEAARIPEEVWSAVTPMLLTTGGDMILLSTPYGAQGEFYRVWVNKEQAYDSFTRFDLDIPLTSELVMQHRPITDYWTEQIKDKALQKLEREKRRMSNREYAQEYLGEFVEDLFRYFPDKLIADRCILQVEEGVSELADYYLGVDIARLGDDEGTYEILKRKHNKSKLYHVRNIISKKYLTTQTEQKIIQLNDRYNFNKIYIDAGSGTLGVSIMDHLLQVPNIRRKIKDINNATRILDRYEGQTKRLLKEDLYDNFRSLLERGELLLLDDPLVIESLQSIQYEYVQKPGQPTKIRIFGGYSHIVEGLIRAAWAYRAKHINTTITSFAI